MINSSGPASASLNYLDAAGLAERLGVTKQWVQHWTREGVIPAIKVGRKYFYTAEQVDEALGQRAA